MDSNSNSNSEREAKRARLDIDLNAIDVPDSDSEGSTDQAEQSASPLFDLNVAPRDEPDVAQTNYQGEASSSGMIAGPSSSRFAVVNSTSDPSFRLGSTNLFTNPSYINPSSLVPTNASLQSSILASMAPNLGFRGVNQHLTFGGGDSWRNEQAPVGKLLCERLPSDLIDDVWQIHEFLYEFKPLLNLQQVPSFKELETELLTPRPQSSHQTLANYNGPILTEIHTKLLQLLFSQLLPLITHFTDPTRQGKNKKDVERSAARRTLNALTWPEMVRRFGLVVSFLGKSVDWSDFSLSFSEGTRILRCLQGDGGVLNGVVSGLAGVEADTLVLVEAQKQISDPANDNKNIISTEIVGLDMASPDANRVPEWALPLEKIKKLPTNVGSKIRECIYQALQMEPPVWARESLGNSISKEVYKHNASGPTKKMALKVLEGSTNTTNNEGNVGSTQTPIPVSHVIMTKCRVILRKALSPPQKPCYLLGSSLIYSDEAGFEGIIGFPGVVSRPIDFRTIDKRLGLGVYGGSHEAFFEEVQEVFSNLRVALADKPDLMEEIEQLSEIFQSLYNEVLDLAQKVALSMQNKDPASEKELTETLEALKILPKAPWDVDICRFCGVDRDDEILLLCDTCNSPYHTYCLNPPLPQVPKGKWYCLNCSKYKGKGKEKEGEKGEEMGDSSCEKCYDGDLDRVLRSMGETDYWELPVQQRIFLLKFLCDELLTTSLLRSHIENRAINSSEFREKLQLLNLNLRNPPIRENQIFQGIITDLESQIRRLCVRTQLIGMDSLNRLYWFDFTSNKRPCLVMDYNNNSNTDSVNERHCNLEADKPHSFVIYESNDDINGLINWLNVHDPQERELKNSILRIQRLIFHQEGSSSNPDPSVYCTTGFVPNLATKALKVLEFLHGPCLNEPPKTEGQKGFYKCSCVEPVWATKNHCFACHETFKTISELESHNNGKCMDLIEPNQTEPSRINEGAKGEIIRLLKTNLLDMEAALSEEGFRVTRSDPARRRKWRSFVKAAESIYEMVQASILLEEMIESKYIKNEWWHWSSLSAASKTPSITAVGLRIYTLDDYLIYLRDPAPF